MAAARTGPVAARAVAVAEMRLALKPSSSPVLSLRTRICARDSARRKIGGGATVSRRMNERFFTRPDTMAGTNARTVIGVIFIGIGLLGFMGNPVIGSQIGIGILFLVAASWAKNNPLISLEDDHFNLKPAIAAARRFVLYRDISSVDDQGNKAFVFLRDGGKIALPVLALSEDRRIELLRELRRRRGACRDELRVKEVMNGLLMVGVVLNTVVALIAGSQGSLLLAIAGLPLLGSYVGLALIASGNRKLGARFALFSSALFVPIGLVAVMGARQILDELAREQLDVQRNRTNIGV